MIGIRSLIGLTLSNVWIGTLGATAITFVIFYLALKYTPLSRYARSVNAVVQEWYSKKYMIYSLISSMTLLSILIFTIEYGYVYHPDRIVSIKDIEIMQRARVAPANTVAYSTHSLLNQGYTGFDTISIVIASVDKSLGGHYIQLISFILAEDIEILIFLILIKKMAGRNLFGTTVPN
jgi:hypothetical protein